MSCMENAEFSHCIYLDSFIRKHINNTERYTSIQFAATTQACNAVFKHVNGETVWRGKRDKTGQYDPAPSAKSIPDKINRTLYCWVGDPAQDRRWQAATEKLYRP